jgi:predicted short-subunit dehydrogenase-like oxidoreductase (DUF2520 family)
MKVGFIGAGKVALAMGSYWLSKRVEILGYSSRNIESAHRLAVLTHTRTFSSPVPLAKEATLIMLTTSDDAIQDVAKTLARSSVHWEKKIVCHMSGVHSSQILSCLYDQGATICSFHPMTSFGNVSSTSLDLKKIFFTFEGRGSRLQEMEDFLQSLGHRYEYISSDEKALYHAAACVLSNYFVVLLNTGIQMLSRSGISQENMIGCLRPLLEQTWKNVLNSGAENALTGPISRGDLGTIRLHLQKITEEGRQDWLEIYKTMGKSAIGLALQTGRIHPEIAGYLLEEMEK